MHCSALGTGDLVRLISARARRLRRTLDVHFDRHLQGDGMAKRHEVHPKRVAPINSRTVQFSARRDMTHSLRDLMMLYRGARRGIQNQLRAGHAAAAARLASHARFLEALIAAIRAEMDPARHAKVYSTTSQ